MKAFLLHYAHGDTAVWEIETDAIEGSARPGYFNLRLDPLSMEGQVTFLRQVFPATPVKVPQRLKLAFLYNSVIVADLAEAQKLLQSWASQEIDYQRANVERYNGELARLGQETATMCEYIAKSQKLIDQLNAESFELT